MTRSIKLTGVVILYNPPLQMKANVLSYVDQIDFLLVVDNSEDANQELGNYFKTLSKVEYLPQPGNPGLARAINLGAQRAKERGADFLLTMDQDSRPSGDMMDQLRQFIQNHDVSRTGIITPYHVTKSGCYPDRNIEYEEVSQTMMSGNLLNLKIYSEVGPLMEELFLDYVDVEYYCRLQAAGYQIVQVNKAFLLHDWGNISFINFFKNNIFLLNYPPLRWYYIIRNLFYVVHKYRGALPEIKQHLFFWFKQVVKVLLFEPAKLLKCKMMLAGFIDYKKGILGKYRQPFP
jgi:rhamnosyltransferase